MKELALGIDLGTTNSCVAVMREHKVEIVPHKGGSLTAPSMIWIGDDGVVAVGHDAKKKFLSQPEKTIYGAKRLIGRSFDSTEMDDIRQRFYYEIAQNDQGEPIVKAGNRYMDLVEVSAIILEYLKNTAKVHLGRAIDSAVISVPAYFNQHQREAVKRAGEQAGLDVLRIVNEPTAAALAYGAAHKNNQRILVYDLGGGTFDVTILEMREQTYEVIATGGDSFLGGIDFDNQLVSYFSNLIKKRHGADVSGDNTALQRLRSAAESAKIDLTTVEQALISVPFLLPDDGNGNPVDFEHRITRELFEEMVRPIALKTLKIVNNVMQDAGLERGQIDDLVFVGGMTRVPLVEQLITRHFGKRPRKDVHPDEVVAEGAAILADAIANNSDVVKLMDVLPVSIGVAVDAGAYETLIAHNTRVPHELSQVFRTTKDNQSGVTVRVFQGESDDPANNEYLGALSIAGFPALPAGKLEYTVHLSLDQDSVLLVSASDPDGRQFFSQFLTERMLEKESYELSSDDLEEQEDNAELEPSFRDTVRSALFDKSKEEEKVPTQALFRSSAPADDNDIDSLLEDAESDYFEQGQDEQEQDEDDEALAELMSAAGDDEEVEDSFEAEETEESLAFDLEPLDDEDSDDVASLFEFEDDEIGELEADEDAEVLEELEEIVEGENQPEAEPDEQTGDINFEALDGFLGDITSAENPDDVLAGNDRPRKDDVDSEQPARKKKKGLFRRG